MQKEASSKTRGHLRLSLTAVQTQERAANYAKTSWARVRWPEHLAQVRSSQHLSMIVITALRDTTVTIVSGAPPNPSEILG